MNTTNARMPVIMTKLVVMCSPLHINIMANSGSPAMYSRLGGSLIGPKETSQILFAMNVEAVMHTYPGTFDVEINPHHWNYTMYRDHLEVIKLTLHYIEQAGNAPVWECSLQQRYCNILIYDQVTRVKGFNELDWTA